MADNLNDASKMQNDNLDTTENKNPLASGQHTNENANSTDNENLPEKDENGEYINRHTDNNTTANAAYIASNPQTKLASDRRDPSEHPARANEATDRNDTGSGGIAAGGAKSGSGLQ